MLKDFLSVLYWWFVISGLGFIFLPLAIRLFNRFFDRGYLFAKVIALSCLSYFVWLGANAKFFPFSQKAILAAVFFGAAANFFLLKKTAQKQKKKLFSSQKALIFISEELIFFLALLFWSFIRGFQPHIEGLEKFMDFGFVNAILRSRYFPPADMWFAGKSINYYYYGHYLAAFLTKLSGLDSAYTYNLMIATLFALTFSLTFSLTANLILSTKRQSKKSPTTNYQLPTTIIVISLFFAFLICFGSNLHTPYYLIKDGPEKYWYPNATRYIGYNPPTNDKTIHEFPAYSFVVADLHGHVSDLPIVITFIAFNFSFLFHFKKKSSPDYLKLVFISLLLAITYMTNTWDTPIYLLFWGVASLFTFYHQKKKLSFPFPVVVFSLIILAGIVVFTLPFNLAFHFIPQGVGFVHSHTPPKQFLILWGQFILPSFFLIPILLKRKRLSFNSVFLLALIATALILLVIPEVIYIKDIYGKDYYRANTMFKFTYQAYVLFIFASAMIIKEIIQAPIKRFLKAPLLSFLLLIFASLLIYPSFSITGYYGPLKLSHYQGLYGLNFLAQRYPDDYQAVLWLKKIPDQPVVLEAAGDSYTDDNRVSALTGLPTIEGWLVHEWLWRGGYEKPQARAQEVAQVYQNASLNRAKKILKKYQVAYIFYGQKEKIKYPQSSYQRLSSLGTPVYRAGKTVVYKVK